MLIEVFTNGKVIIDGAEAPKNYRAEEVLYDYLTNEKGFLEAKKPAKPKKKKAI
jgi:hypothetical protein